MKRRNFLEYAGTTLGTASGLLGCGGGGGGGDSPSPLVPQPTPTPSGSFPFALGAARPPDEEIAARPVAFSKTFAAAAAALPASVDNTSNGFLPPPGDQGSQPSCTAWAVAYGMSSYMAARAQAASASSSSNQASPADLYAKLIAEMKTSCNQGTLIKTAMDIVTRDGLASQADLPYRDNACFQPQSSRRFAITGYAAVSTKDRTALKRELADGKVLPFGAGVYADFSNVTSAVYVRKSQTLAGNHAMLLVGYDDRKDAFRVMNSWGSWGDRGYCWVGYETFSDMAFEAFSPTAGSPTPSPTPPSPGPSPNPVPTPPTPTPPPVVLPGFAAADGFTTYDYFYNQAVLLIEFSLSAPMLVQTVEIVYVPTGFSFGIGSVNQWMLQSYFTVTNRNVFYGATYIPGIYQLNLTAVTQAGAPVRLSVRVNIPVR